MALSAALLAAIAWEARAETATGSRTDPKTWSEEGFLEFRFGMGPGDVQDILVAPDSRMRSRTSVAVGTPSSEGQSDNVRAIETNYVLCGQPMSGSFGFVEGRLASILLIPSRVFSDPSTLNKNDGWIDEVTALLVKNIGLPDEEERLQRRWIRGKTEIRVTITGGLIYSDVDLIAREKRIEAELKERKERLAATGALPKTPRASWAKTGWAKFFWGMGPGDVSAVVKPHALEPSFGGPRDPGEEHYNAELDEELYGRYLSAYFTFRNDRLIAITLSGRSGGEKDIESTRRWHGWIEEGLTDKYGKPACEKSSTYSRCVWVRKDRTKVQLDFHEVQDTAFAGLYYSASAAADEKRAKKKAMQKL